MSNLEATVIIIVPNMRTDIKFTEKYGEEGEQYKNIILARIDCQTTVYKKNFY